MDEFNRIIWEYLDDEYIICDDYDYPQLISQGQKTEIHTVNKEISLFFNLDDDESQYLLKKWLYQQGVYEPQCGWNSIFIGPNILKTIWPNGLELDIKPHNIEAELTAIIAQKLSDEINSNIFNNLISKVKNANELLTVMGDIGYIRESLAYNPDTFEPMQRFVKKRLLKNIY